MYQTALWWSKKQGFSLKFPVEEILQQETNNNQVT